MSPTPERPELRIGDVEREAAVSALGDHYAAGRLTKDEYDERAAVAWAARTNSDLWPLFLDLPRPVGNGAKRSSDRAATTPASQSGRDGWSGARLMPMVLVALGLTIFALGGHWILFLVLLWVLVAKLNRHSSRRKHGSDHHRW
jgi:hypothetical protein